MQVLTTAPSPPHRYVQDFTSAPLECEVLDEDEGPVAHLRKLRRPLRSESMSRDDPIGFAEVSQRQMYALFADAMSDAQDGDGARRHGHLDAQDGDGAASVGADRESGNQSHSEPLRGNHNSTDRESGRDFALQLTTRGVLHVNVAVVEVAPPSYTMLLRRLLLLPLVRLYAAVAQLSQLALVMQREYTTVTIKVTLHRATNLKAADMSFIGRGSSSDPYVNFELAGQVLQSSLKTADLNPVWDGEEFKFVTTLGELDKEELDCL